MLGDANGPSRECIPPDRRLPRSRRPQRSSPGARGRAGKAVAQLLALAQTLLVAQVGLGLLLLSDHRRAADRLHYAYGTFALLAVLARGCTRRRIRVRGSSGSRSRPSSPPRSASAPT